GGSLMKSSTERRLLKYAWTFKKGIIVGIICLMIAVIFELAGPLIAKTIIDDHILGVEGIWQKTEDENGTVSYKGNDYKRQDRMTDVSDSSKGVTIMQIGKSYYFIDEEVPLSGKRHVDDGVITIEMANDTVRVNGDKMSVSDVYPFFQPEKRPIILLLALYVGLLFVAGIFQFFQTFILQRTSNQIVRKMRNDVFAHTQRIPIDYYVDQPAGRIVSRITNDTEAIRDLYERVLSIMVTSIIYMGGIITALFILDYKLGLMCLI